MASTGRSEEIEEIRGSGNLADMWSACGRGSVSLWQGRRGLVSDLKIISLGLFDPFGQYDRHSWTSSGTGAARAADILKKIVLASFLADVGKAPEGWNEVREVVTNEVLSKYQSGVLCDPSRAKIGRSALALDAIFVACLLIHRMLKFGHQMTEPSSMSIYAEYLSKKLQSTFSFLDVIDHQNIDELFEETFKLENQIPLELIRNVILIACTPPGSEATYEVQASGILRAICRDFVTTFGITFPSFHLASKYNEVVLQVENGAGVESRPAEMELVCHSPESPTADNLHADSQVPISAEGPRAQVNEEADWPLLQGPGAELLPAQGRRVGSQTRNSEQELDFLNCDNLLHCFAEAFWRGAQVRSETSADLQEPSEHEPLRTNLPTATALKQSGVKLESQNEFLPKLKRGRFWWWEATLFLPTVSAFDRRTEQRWKNLLAFEDKYKRDSEMYSFTSYLRFMHSLIKTQTDVNFLKEGDAPIFCTQLENDEVLEIFLKFRENDYHQSSHSPGWSCMIKEISMFDNSTFRKEVRKKVQRLMEYGLISGILILLKTAFSLYVLWCFFSIFLSFPRQFKDIPSNHFPHAPYPQIKHGDAPWQRMNDAEWQRIRGAFKP